MDQKPVLCAILPHHLCESIIPPGILNLNNSTLHHMAGDSAVKITIRGVPDPRI